MSRKSLTSHLIMQARTQGGVGGVVRHPLDTAGIDFYSGFRKNDQGGVQIEILKDPGIDFHSGFRKNDQGGGVQIEILKKSRYRLL